MENQPLRGEQHLSPELGGKGERAAAVCFAGFYQALAEGKIADGETVLINTGEGSARAKAFAEAVKKA